MTTLAGRTAFVTGGAGGIGSATALALSRAGAAVAVVDLGEERVEAAASRIAEEGGRATGVVCDVADPESVAAAFDRVEVELGLVDVLFNNAGIVGPETTAPETPIEEFDRCVAVNLRAPFLCAAECIRRLRGAGRPGAIVNTASVNAFFAEPGFPAYVATKGAIVALTRALALDHAREGIQVNCVCPGYVETPMTQSVTDDASALGAIGEMHAVGRLAQPEEIAAVVVFLSSEAASFMAGAAVMVDGGMSIGAQVLSPQSAG